MTKKLLIGLVGVLIIGALTFAGIKLVKAETSGGSPDSGVASYIKTIYTSLVAKTQGSDAAGAWGDWGAYWNRISSTTARRSPKPPTIPSLGPPIPPPPLAMTP